MRKRFKPFYIKVAHRIFKKNDILRTCAIGTEVIVLNPYCKDQWWRKLGRKLGFKIQNIEGLLKVKRYERKK